MRFLSRSKYLSTHQRPQDGPQAVSRDFLGSGSSWLLCVQCGAKQFLGKVENECIGPKNAFGKTIMNPELVWNYGWFFH